MPGLANTHPSLKSVWLVKLVNSGQSQVMLFSRLHASREKLHGLSSLKGLRRRGCGYSSFLKSGPVCTATLFYHCYLLSESPSYSSIHIHEPIKKVLHPGPQTTSAGRRCNPTTYYMISIHKVQQVLHTTSRLEPTSH